MSQSQPTARTSPPEATASSSDNSEYRRDNWWGNNSTGSDTEVDVEESTVEDEQRDVREWGMHHRFSEAVTKEEYVAKSILRHGADVLCPRCLHVDDRAVVISDPEHYVPRVVQWPIGDGELMSVELAVLPDRRRHCESCGYVTFGGPLADRTTAEFRDVLDSVGDAVDVPPDTFEKARSDALADKGRGKHDVTIMQRFVRQLLYPDDFTDEYDETNREHNQRSNQSD